MTTNSTATVFPETVFHTPVYGGDVVRPPSNTVLPGCKKAEMLCCSKLKADVFMSEDCNHSVDACKHKLLMLVNKKLCDYAWRQLSNLCKQFVPKLLVQMFHMLAFRCCLHVLEFSSCVLEFRCIKLLYGLCIRCTN